MLVEKIEVFLQILEKSGLLSPSQLVEARRYSVQEPADPISIAKQLIRAGLLNKWQANHLLRGRAALSLGQYPFLDQIDAGRDQRLYLSKDPDSGELIEIKVFSRRQSSGDSAGVQRLQEQSFRLAGLDHPGLVKVRGAERVDGRYILVAEHLGGRTLAEVLAEGKPLPIETAANYLLRAAEALAYAHKNGFAHGDLRPSNLILDTQGDLRVARLGFMSLAPLSGSESGGEDLGNEPRSWHRAPEVGGGGGESTAAGDLYSLGAILFALVTGSPPEGPQTAKEVREARPDVPQEWSALMERLLAASPNDRETSADAVVEILRTWRAGQAAGRPKSRPSKQPPEERGGVSASETPKGGKTPPGALPGPSPSHPEDATDATDGEPEIEVLPADGPMSDLGLRTKARRRPRAPGAKPRKKAASNRLLSQPALLAGAVGGGIALIGLSVLVFVLSRGDATVEISADAEAEAAIAENVEPSDPKSEPADPLAEREIDPDPLETDPVLPSGSQPDRAGDSSMAMLAPQTEPEHESETAPDPTSVEAEDHSASPAADDERSAEAAEPPPDSRQAPLPEEEQQQQQQPTEQPEEEQPEEEQPEEEQPEEEQPEEEQPEEDLPAPFSELPAVVRLPALDAADAMQPVTLGNIYAGRDELCFIRMRGGGSAVRGGHAFSLRNARGGLAEREWEVWLRPSGGQDQLIAQLVWNEKFELVFQWQPDAAEQPLAAHLKNCALSFTCRGETQVSVLREPERHEPLRIDWEQATARQEWELPFSPNPDELWVEVVQLEGAEHAIDPQPPIIRAARGEAWVRIADAGGVLMLKIEPDLRRGFFVTVSPHVQLRQDAPPERLNIRQLNIARQNLQAGIQQLTMGIEQTKAVRSKLPEAQRKRAEQEMRTFENELNMAKEHLKQFEEFEKVLKQVQPRLHLRLFYRADGSEVSLLRIGE